jgi:DNA-binding response OmpR family regulator
MAEGELLMRVLVAEDHEQLARAVAAGLRRYGMVVDVALDGDDALARLGANRYDVVVLDRDLPGTHGDVICRTLAAERSESRVLMLTAATSVRDRVEGLGLGADDYLGKPFDFSEMVARVQALGRRPGAPKPEHLGYRDLSVDPERRLATRAGRPLALSPKEFAILECLLVAEGGPVSAEELLERVWDRATDPFTTTVKATINRLRTKLGDPPMIETVREAGYRIGGL